MLETLPLVFTSGWASGINAYAVVLLLGLLGRFGGAEVVPLALQRTDVLALAAVLFAIEIVVDKIPWLDSAWDAVHTFVRPTVGAAIGLLLAGDVTDAQSAVLTAAGGTTALASHAVKASLRLAANTSPEPASNIALSTGEDLAVAGLVTLAIVAPWVAAGLAALLLALGAVLTVLLAQRIARARQRWRDRRDPRGPATRRATPPPPT